MNGSRFAAAHLILHVDGKSWVCCAGRRLAPTSKPVSCNRSMAASPSSPSRASSSRRYSTCLMTRRQPTAKRCSILICSYHSNCAWSQAGERPAAQAGTCRHMLGKYTGDKKILNADWRHQHAAQDHHHGVQGSAPHLLLHRRRGRGEVLADPQGCKGASGEDASLVCGC
jgi:hypothetical protein